MKLRIELVPITCWYRNIRKQVSKSVWDKLRREVYATAGHICEICEGGGILNCHERWKYDDKKHVQKLRGFRAVCSMCHHVTHFGVTQILAAQGHLNLDSVIEHFMQVNRLGRATFDLHKAEAFRVWRERSKFKWKSDFGKWERLLCLENRMMRVRKEDSNAM